MYEITISEAARDDMKESSIWYEEQQIGLSKQFLKEVFLTLSYIENAPLHYSIRFSGKFHFAKVTRFPFLIVYEVFQGKIIINAVFHTSRNPQNF